jgi:hypothetical protein
MASALDLIKGALRRINSYQSGEQIAPPDAQDCLDTLNDLFDSWSTDKQMVFGTNEAILQWVAGKNSYKVGNPKCTDIGEPPFTGTLTNGSPIITGVTNIPADLVAGSSASAVGAGSSLTDTQGLLPAVYVTAIGVNTVTMSAPAKGNSNGLDQLTYTIPGDFAIPRPLRITGGYTRISQLDFSLDVYASQDEYNAVLFKAQPGPWPTIGWYNNLMPYGVLNVYQTPGQNGELHLFTDTILANLTLNQTFILPQGYTRAIKWCLAKEICAEYGYPLTEAIKTNADESLKLIKALNAKPAQRAKYDRQLVRGNRADGGWVLHGGYGR